MAAIEGAEGERVTVREEKYKTCGRSGVILSAFRMSAHGPLHLLVRLDGDPTETAHAFYADELRKEEKQPLSIRVSHSTRRTQ